MDPKFSNTPLAGCRVIEIGQIISAPYAGLLLADMGAEVIKVEPPGIGDSARNPEVSGYLGKSATFITLNRNKRSISLDLRDPDDYETFSELIRGADVVLTNMVPEVAARLRISPDELRVLNPRIITCRILGFRADHPLVNEPSFDLTHQALAGYLTLGGHAHEGPARVAIPLADLTVAMYGAYGILGALVNRERTGLGDDIDVAMYDSMLSLLTYQATLYLNQGEIPDRLGTAHPHTAPWQAFHASDGDFVVAVRNDKFWARLCEAIGRPDLPVDVRFVSNEGRINNRLALEAELSTEFAREPVEHWLSILRGGGVPVAPVRGIGDALDAEVESHSSLLQEFEDPDLGRVKIVGNPVRYSRMDLVTPEAAPELDELGRRRAAALDSEATT